MAFPVLRSWQLPRIVAMGAVSGIAILAGCSPGVAIPSGSVRVTGSGPASSSGAAPTFPSSIGGSPAPSGMAASPPFAPNASGSKGPARSAAPTPPAVSVAPGRPSSPAASAPAGVVELTPTPAVSETPESSGSRAATGDVPDNAVFLRYEAAALHISIQYVEGWQVVPRVDGVVIADKDSSETVQVAQTSDPAGFAAADLVAVQAEPHVKLLKQDRVRVNGHVYDHLQYTGVSDPDPVTGKQVPSTIERYYVPGAGAVAIVTLSTPDGVDNIDAFRQMIESFTWL